MQRRTHQRSDFGRGLLFAAHFLSRFCSNFKAQNSTRIWISKALGLCLQALTDRSSSQPCPSQTLGTIHCPSIPCLGCWLQPYLGRYSHPCPARAGRRASALPGELLTPQPCLGRCSHPSPARAAIHTPALPGSLLTPQPCPGRSSHPSPARAATHARGLPGSLLTPQPCPGRSSHPSLARVAPHAPGLLGSLLTPTTANPSTMARGPAECAKRLNNFLYKSCSCAYQA